MRKVFAYFHTKKTISWRKHISILFINKHCLIKSHFYQFPNPRQFKVQKCRLSITFVYSVNFIRNKLSPRPLHPWVWRPRMFSWKRRTSVQSSLPPPAISPNKGDQWEQRGTLLSLRVTSRVLFLLTFVLVRRLLLQTTLGEDIRWQQWLGLRHQCRPPPAPPPPAPWLYAGPDFCQSHMFWFTNFKCVWWPEMDYKLTCDTIYLHSLLKHNWQYLLFL